MGPAGDLTCPTGPVLSPSSQQLRGGRSAFQALPHLPPAFSGCKSEPVSGKTRQRKWFHETLDQNPQINHEK